jgi:hypothetical protein
LIALALGIVLGNYLPVSLVRLFVTFNGGKIGASPPTFSPLFSLKNRLKNGAFPFIFGTFEQKKTAKRPKKRSIPVH